MPELNPWAVVEIGKGLVIAFVVAWLAAIGGLAGWTDGLLLLQADQQDHRQNQQREHAGPGPKSVACATRAMPTTAAIRQADGRVRRPT